MKLKMHPNFLCAITFLLTFVSSRISLFALQPKPTPQQYLASDDYKITLQTAQKIVAQQLWQQSEKSRSEELVEGEKYPTLADQFIGHYVAEINKKYQAMGAPVHYITLVDGSLVTQVFSDPQKAAIVNAANERLLGGSGIDGVIWNAVGPDKSKARADFEKQCLVLRRKKYLINQGKSPQSPYRGDKDPISNGTETDYGYGDAGLTLAFGGLAKKVGYVIHAVGTIKKDQQELAAAYQNSLNRAQEAGLNIIAFCPISAGIWGYDIDQATPVAINAVIEWLQNHPKNTINEVRFVTYTPPPDPKKQVVDEYDIYTQSLEAMTLRQDLPLKTLSSQKTRQLIEGHYLAQSSAAPGAKPPLVFMVQPKK